MSLNENELRISAVKEYKARLAEMSEDSELISVKTNHSFENGVYIIECNLYYVTDIAEKVPYIIASEEQDDKQ